MEMENSMTNKATVKMPKQKLSPISLVFDWSGPELSPTEQRYIKIVLLILEKELLSPSVTKVYKTELMNRLKFLTERITGT